MAEHRVELRFQFAPMKVTIDPDGWIRAHGSKGHGLLIQAFAMVPLRADVYEGELNPIRGWISPNYGHLRPGPALIYSAVTRLPLRVMTLLLPTEDAFAPSPEVSLLVDKDSGPGGLLFADEQKSVCFSAEDFAMVHALR
jgi:hypothetical protein